NTVVIDRQGRTTGHNTDVTGFAAGFRAGLAGVATEAVVQIGAGGAGRAVGFALAERGVGELVIADTDIDRAQGPAAHTAAGGAGGGAGCGLADLGVGELVIADTDIDRAQGLAADIGAVGAQARAIGPEELEAAAASANGVVNATPMGMKAYPGTPIDTTVF